MVHGNNVGSTRKHRTLFIGQKTYFSPLAGVGGNVYNLLLAKPMGLDDDNDPAQNVDSTVVTTADGARTLKHDIVWVYPSSDITRILNHAECTMTVEVGLNATIDDISVQVGKYDLATAVFTVTGTEHYQTQPAGAPGGLALVGPTSRKIKVWDGDTTPQAISAGERPAYRTKIWAHRTAGGIAVPVTIWHQRGHLDTYMVMDAVKQDM
jgi:hypothetical protein